ncbi:MAG: right-handed parallel beta-helix repeat-containing protein, partial [Elainellaceae cyanobacterium]
MSTYYVSRSGNNSNKGSQSSPFKTIQQAIDRASAGDTIYVREGSYDSVDITGKKGTASKPITLAAYPGDEGSVSISTGSYSSGKGINIENSSHIKIKGFDVKKSLFGIFGTRSNGITVENNLVRDIGQEAVHFRGDSRDIEIIDNKISGTGKRGGNYSRWSEGIYLGAGKPSYPGEGAHNILVKGNEISDTRAEAIDIKPSVSNVIVEDNLIHDIKTERSGAVVVGINSTDKTDFTNADNVIIRNNKIWNVTRTSPYADGNAIKAESSATIHGNVIWNYQHRGIFVERAESDNNFKIFDNKLYASGSEGDIVVAKTSAGVDQSKNTVSGGSPSTPKLKFSFQPTLSSDTSPEPEMPDSADSPAPPDSGSPSNEAPPEAGPIPTSEAAPEADPISTPAPSASDAIRIEAESMDLSNYRIESKSAASDGKLISFIGGASNETGTATVEFSGEAGTYDVNLTYFDETDGTAKIQARHGDTVLDTVTLDQQLGSATATAKTKTEKTVASQLSLQPGDTLSLKGFEEASEHARIDYLEFLPVEAKAPIESKSPDVSATPDGTSAPAPEVGQGANGAAPIQVEAEKMQLSGAYRVETNAAASDDKLISLRGGDTATGSATLAFSGQSGTYDINLAYFDENDGVGSLKLSRNGDPLADITMNQQLDGNAASRETLTT